MRERYLSLATIFYSRQGVGQFVGQIFEASIKVFGKMIEIHILITAFLMMAPSFGQATISIEKCDKFPTAKRKIEQALVIISENMEYILNHELVRELTEEEKQRYRDVFYGEDFPIVCRHSSKNDCKRGGYPISGYAALEGRFNLGRGLVQRGAYMCGANVTNGRGCRFHGTVAHEIAHLAELPMSEFHSDMLKIQNSSEFDTVQKIGFIVTDLCENPRR